MNQNHKKLWTFEEDQILKDAVQMVSKDKWKDVANKFEELFLIRFSKESKRNGKQCRQRWYNKLDPALEKTKEDWTDQQDVALLNIYNQIGPKWSKIVFSLNQIGYKRRSQNHLKNRFHILVKKTVNRINLFSSNFNIQVKRSKAFQNNKKKYVYDKTYSIQQMLKKNNSVSSIKKQTQQNIELSPSCKQWEPDNAAEDNDRKAQKEKRELSDLNLPQYQQNNEQKMIKIQNQSCSHLTDSHQQPGSDKNHNAKSSLLKKIEKKQIDKLLLYFNDIDQTKLEMVPNIDQERLKETVNQFLRYMKFPIDLEYQQIQQLLRNMYSCLKSCKKINKKSAAKKIKQRKSLKKFEFQRTVKQLYQKIINVFPQLNKKTMDYKTKICQRLLYLAQKILLKQEQLDQQINRDCFLSKKDENNIFKIIIEEINNLSPYIYLPLENKHMQNYDQSEQIQQELLQSQQEEQEQEEQEQEYGPKIKRIRKQIKKGKLQHDDSGQGNQKASKFPQNNCLDDSQQHNKYTRVIEVVHPFSKQLEEPYKEKSSNVNKFQCSLNDNFGNQNQNQNSKSNVKQKQNQGSLKSRDNNFQALFRVQKAKVNKNPQFDLSLRFPRSIQNQEKLLLQQSQIYSQKSRKSIRPQKLPNQYNNILITQTPIKCQKNITQQLKIQTPNCLFRTIQFQKRQNLMFSQIKSQQGNRQIKYNPSNITQRVMPQHSNYVFSNMHNVNPFQFNNEPLRFLGGSQQYFDINNSILNKASETNFNTIGRPKSIYNSVQYLAMSCQNMARSQMSIQGKMQILRENEFNFMNNNFLQNIRNIQQNQQIQRRQTKIISFQLPHNQHCNQPILLNHLTQSKGFTYFNPFNSQQLQFEVPKKLIETVQNANFPLKNYNDYSLNYQHKNSFEHSKLLQFDRNFGFNSARLSEIQFLKSQYRNQSQKSKSNQFEKSQALFKSQKIQSLNESYQFMIKSKHLSNSCIYSNRGSLENSFQMNHIQSGKQIKQQPNNFDAKQIKEENEVYRDSHNSRLRQCEMK